MNNKELSLSEKEKERVLKEVLTDVFEKVKTKKYQQAYRVVKNEFMLDTLNSLFNIEFEYYDMKLTDIVYNDMTLNRKIIQKIMLNGAGSWDEWSFGGCGMVYTSDLQLAFNKPKLDGAKLLKLQARCYLDVYFTICDLICDALEKKGFSAHE
jgi:hypothetical protein